MAAQDIDEIDLSYFLDQFGDRNEHLELSESQLIDLNDLKEKIRSWDLEQLDNLGRLKKTLPPEEYVKSFEMHQAEKFRRLQIGFLEILTPHQQQIVVRMRLWQLVNDSYGYQQLFKVKLVANRLSISKQKQDSIVANGEALQKEFEAELAKLREKYRNRLLKSELSPKQILKAKRLFGKVGPSEIKTRF